MSVFFNGRLLVSPVTASVVNDDAMRNQNLNVGNVVALVGRSTGGQPKTALRYGSPQEAEKELGSGELLDAVLAAFNPSAETNGPSTVVAVRVNPATQSSAVVRGAGAEALIDLKSTNYGLAQNLLKYKIEAGSVAGLRMTVQLGQAYYSRDNIQRRALSVSYTGALATAVVSVNATEMTLSAPSGTAVATLDLSQYPTVQDLVDRINAITDFEAVVLDRNGTQATASALDFITGVDCKTAPVIVRGDLQAVIDWVNSTGEGFATATRSAAAGVVPAPVGWRFLSGGSDGVTTFDDWADAFEVLQSVDVQWLCPISGDAAIHAAAEAHASYMSNAGMKERRVICGTPLATSDTAAIAAASALNSDRCSLVHIGHYNYDSTGTLVLFAPYISAALIAGMFSGVNPGTPLTNKSIKVRGLERDLRNPTDTDDLINGGVLCLENTDAGYKVVKSISTWMVNNNYNRVEQSTGVALDFTARNVRSALDALRGQKANPLVLSRAISITESTLRELAREEPQGPGVLAGNGENPAYRNITASLEGDVLRVGYECSPVIPVNYVLNTIYAVPFTGSASA